MFITSETSVCDLPIRVEVDGKIMWLGIVILMVTFGDWVFVPLCGLKGVSGKNRPLNRFLFSAFQEKSRLDGGRDFFPERRKPNVFSRSGTGFFQDLPPLRMGVGRFLVFSSLTRWGV